MKVFLFSHIDADGIGSIVLSKLAFDEVEYVLCENNGYNGVNDVFRDHYNKGELNTYDKIFFTDIGLSVENIELLNNDVNFKDKVLMLDHHISQQDIVGKYDWVKILVEDEKGKCCGTSLFYEYLLNNGLLKETNIVNDFVEFTRQYDVWEWKARDNKIAEDMNILLLAVDSFEYTKMMYEKLISGMNEFAFNDKERYLIDLEEKKIRKYVGEKVDNMIVKQIDGFRAGVIFADRYVNFIADDLRTRELKVDYCVCLDLAKRRAYYRSMGEVETYKIAVKYGGKGNRMTGGHSLPVGKVEKVIDMLYKFELISYNRRKGGKQCR